MSIERAGLSFGGYLQQIQATALEKPDRLSYGVSLPKHCPNNMRRIKENLPLTLFIAMLVGGFLLVAVTIYDVFSDAMLAIFGK